MKTAYLLASVLLLAAASCDHGPNPNSYTPPPDGRVTFPDTGAPADLRTSPDLPPTPCGSDGEFSFGVAGWNFVLSHFDGSWVATSRDGSAMMRGPASCTGEPAIAILDESPMTNSAFGNFDIDLTGAGEWMVNDPTLPSVRVDESGLALTYRIGAREAKLVFTDSISGGLHVDLHHDAQSAEFRLNCAPEDAFFGLGTQVTGMNLRGRTYPLWTQEQGNGKPEGGGNFPFNNTPEAAYAPMGVLHSTAGWTGIVTHDGYTEIDLCDSDAGQIAVRSHRANPGLLLNSGSPRDRMTWVSSVVGRVRDDVPPWTFGLWVDSVTGPGRLATVTDTLRNNGIPTSAIWSEDWIGGESSMFGFRLSYDWVWDEGHYPNLPMLVDALHVRGFAFLAYFNTFIPEPTSIWPEAQANGYFVEDGDGAPVVFLDPAFRNAGLVDLFNPAAVDWLRGHQVSAVNDIGVDGWMADFSEWYPLESPDAWEKHNLYALQWQRVNDAHLREARPDGNYIFFPRSGWASVFGGTGGAAPVMWGGDQNTNWGYDDGFPTIVPIGAHVGLSGVPIFGSDTAGYNSIGPVENTSKELWFRWAATAAFHPLMRTHHGGDECENWSFDRDQETLDHLARWSSVHSMLFPEFQRLYTEAHTLGWPISRHPWLVEPDRPELWTGEQYNWFLGDDIWVAPVLEEGATTRDLAYPGGGWWPIFGDRISALNLVDAPITEVPAFVRAGRALVLLADAVDSFYGASDGVTSDLDDVANIYRVAMYADGRGDVATAAGAPFEIGGRDLDGYDSAAATFLGNALPACGDPVVESCVDGPRVWLVGVTAGSVVAGTATIDIDAATPLTVGLGIGGSAWGNVASPTGYTPNPDAASWCPPE